MLLYKFAVQMYNVLIKKPVLTKLSQMATYGVKIAHYAMKIANNGLHAMHLKKTNYAHLCHPWNPINCGSLINGGKMAYFGPNLDTVASFLSPQFY